MSKRSVMVQLKHTFPEQISLSTEVDFKDSLYKKGCFLCLKCESDESIKFGQIPHSSLCLSEHGLYEVKQAAEDMHWISIHSLCSV